jgi:hypothetical protein
MSYNIKDPEAETMLQALADASRKSKAEILRAALKQALEDERRKIPLWERVSHLQDRVAAYKPRSIDWGRLKEQNDEDWGL